MAKKSKKKTTKKAVKKQTAPAKAETKNAPKKKFSVKMGIGAFILILLVGLFILSLPATPEPTITPDNTASMIYMALAVTGITDAAVAIDNGTVIVDFTLPEGAEVDATVGYVLAVAAEGAPESKTISMHVYQGEQKIQEITVATADVTAAINNQITIEELDSKIQRA